MEKPLITLLRETIKDYPNLFGAIGENHKGAELFSKYVTQKRKDKYDFVNYLKEEGKHDPFAQKMAVEIENMIKKGQFTDQVMAALERIFIGLNIAGEANEIKYKYDAALKEALRHSIPQAVKITVGGGEQEGLQVAKPKFIPQEKPAGKPAEKSVPRTQQKRMVVTQEGYRQIQKINPLTQSMMTGNFGKKPEVKNYPEENQEPQESRQEENETMASATPEESSGGMKILKRTLKIGGGTLAGGGILSFLSGGEAQGAVFGFIKHLF